jgi:hypothetical protein
MKQIRPATRAPHGKAEFTERISFQGNKKQKRFFSRVGGKGLRDLIDRAILESKVNN